MSPGHLVPNHYDVLDGKLHLRRFKALCQRVLSPGQRALAEGER
jgi:hypothetical protein